jgi:hypothetical protein
MRLSKPTAITFMLVMLSLAACDGSDVEVPVTATTEREATISAARMTLEVRGTEMAASQPTETSIPEFTATSEPSLTPTHTQTAAPPAIQVSVNTNCRSGPDPSFEFLGVLAVGEQSEVVARSEIPNYWYIVNPDKPDEYCWLWGEYATIDADTSSLPVVTPEATPTPYVGFDIWFHGFEPCGGSLTAIFAIKNAGATRIWSGWVAVYAMDPLDDLYGPAKERHPFADSPLPACPPGHGNELYPGEIRYIHAPLSSFPGGRDGYAEVTLCSADHGGGDCVTKIGYFYIP